MRILQIVPTLNSGGAEHFVFELSNELRAQGHHVEILTLFDVPDENPLRRGFDSQIIISSLKKKKGLDIRVFYLVLQFINKHKFDVVHGHVGAIKYMLFASFLCRKVHFVATIHSEARREAGKNIEKWSRKLMFGLRSCTPVTISDESERSFEAFYGRKATMIINGVSAYKKKKDVKLKDHEGQIVFLHPASCQPVKNQELLLKSFNRLLGDGVDAKLVWVGYNKSYLDLFNSLAPLMRKNVTYLGVVNNVRDYMVVSDAVCLSSKMEGMPMTIIEAFSVGRPVLCTPVGGCVNMIKQGENGMMSDDLSEEAYYRILSSFVTLSKGEKKRLSAKSLESFDDYKINNCANSYLQVYSQATK